MSACGAWRGVARLLGYCGVIYLGRCLRDDHVEGCIVLTHGTGVCRLVVGFEFRGERRRRGGGGVVAVFA